MRNNVVSLTTRRSVPPVITVKDEAEDFIFNTFYEWAREKGIDTTTTEFKYDAAVVMTTVQSLLHKRG